MSDAMDDFLDAVFAPFETQRDAVNTPICQEHETQHQRQEYETESFMEKLAQQKIDEQTKIVQPTVDNRTVKESSAKDHKKRRGGAEQVCLIFYELSLNYFNFI